MKSIPGDSVRWLDPARRSCRPVNDAEPWDRHDICGQSEVHDVHRIENLGAELEDDSVATAAGSDGALDRREIEVAEMAARETCPTPGIRTRPRFGPESPGTSIGKREERSVDCAANEVDSRTVREVDKTVCRSGWDDAHHWIPLRSAEFRNGGTSPGFRPPVPASIARPSTETRWRCGHLGACAFSPMATAGFRRCRVRFALRRRQRQQQHNAETGRA